MHCEFCSVGLFDMSEARRHMLTIQHTRKKREYDLNPSKYIERIQQAALHPKDFYELIKLLNMHSSKDIEALDANNFFTLSTNFNSRIARELIDILHKSVREFFLLELPTELRQPFVQAIARQL